MVLGKHITRTAEQVIEMTMEQKTERKVGAM